MFLFKQQKRSMFVCISVALSAFATLAIAGPEQDTILAEDKFAVGDLVASMALWRKAAEQGYAPAQVRLADILDKSEEDAEAVVWYRKAAAQGDAAGEFGLGHMYAKGEGVKRDLEQARSFILRAAEKNYLPAITMLMGAYTAGGLGLTPDPVQAKVWKDRYDVFFKEKTNINTGKTP